MEKIDLFSTKIYKTYVDPNLYNRDDIIKAVTINYNKQPDRLDSKKFQTNSHHTFLGWDNPNFEKIDLSYLNKIYYQKTQEFFDHFKIQKNVKWNGQIVNIHASKSHQGIFRHGHLPAFYSTVHFIKMDETHQKLRFYNPSTHANYINLINNVDNTLEDCIDNSIFMYLYTLDLKENDMIFFPSFLEHDAYLNSHTDSLRISASTNISLELEDNL